MHANGIEYTVQPDLRHMDDSYELVLCLTAFHPPESFPRSCKVVYGPHLFVFPDDTRHPIHSYTYEKDRFFYNCLTEWNAHIFRTLAPELSLTPIACPFGLDMDSIEIAPPARARSKILVYCKARHPSCLDAVLRFLEEKQQSVVVLKYGAYHDSDFKQQLKDAKMVVWIGSHESQGFAFQETQASNIPILVWDVTSVNDEYNYGWPYASYIQRGHPLLATTANCWSDACGIKIHDASELEQAFASMNERIDTFTPRDFIQPTLSLTAAFARLLHTVGISSSS